VILAYLLGEPPIGDMVRSEILRKGRGGVFLAGPAVAELFYILCRRKGREFAREAVEALLWSGYVRVGSSTELDVEAGRYKCERSVSLADCYVLAMAKLLGAAAVFARREHDLAREMSLRKFDVGVLFLEDIP